MKFVTWLTKKIFVRALNSIKSSRKNIWKEFKRLQCSYDLAIRSIIQQLAFVSVLVISAFWWASLWASAFYVQSFGYVLRFRHLNALLLFEHETPPLPSKGFCWITPERRCASDALKVQFSNCRQVLKEVINYFLCVCVTNLIKCFLWYWLSFKALFSKMRQ